MKKLRRLLRNAALFCALGSVGDAAGVNLADWKHLQEVEVRSPGVLRIPLSASTLDAGSENLRDLRLLDPAGQEQSYLLEHAHSNPSEQRRVARFDVRLRDATTEITIATGTNAALDTLELDSPDRHFIKAARVEISADGRQWTEFGRGIPLFRLPGSEQLQVGLDGQRAPHVRLQIDDSRSTPVPFTRASVRLARVAASPDVAIGAEIGRREEFAGETVLTIALEGRHAALSKLVFETPEPVFTRRVTVGVREFRDGAAEERIVASGTIHRLRVDGLEVHEQLELPLHFVAPARELVVHVHNLDAPPLAASSLKFFRRPTSLVFHASRAGVHLLLSGNPQARAPSYDLAGFAREFRRASMPTVVPGAIEANPTFQPTDSLAGVALLGAPLELDRWKHARAITLGAAPSQELELDLAVLSHARPDLGDVRLVQNGRQIPFLVEHTRLSRALTLPVQAEPDARRPSFSIWKLTLPREALPLSRITLSSPTTLFERTLHLYEVVKTDRGDTYKRTLGTAQWRQTPDRDNAQTLAIPLGTTVETNALFIETDNGDNPVIALEAAVATYPVTRLVFKASGDTPVSLHYGNSNAVAPRYDLSLMAESLLSTERAVAALGDEEKEAGDLARGALRGLRGGPLFWISLGIVVVVLLVVVARHLPKPEEPVG